MIISLHNISLEPRLTKHYDYETSEFQKILIDIDCKSNVVKPITLADTIDYAKLEQTVVDYVMSKQFVLLENIAEELADLVLNNFSVYEVTIAVTKPDILKYATSATVSFTRSKGAEVFLSLGSNLGDRHENIAKGISVIGEFMQIGKVSSFYENDAILPDNAPQDWNLKYVNAVLYGYTKLSPHDLLNKCKLIEFNRSDLRWSPRGLDVDILLYGNKMVFEKNLVIPHQEMMKRDFIIKLMKEISPDRFNI